METYVLNRSECTSLQGSRRGKIEKQVITMYRNTTEGVYSVKGITAISAAHHLCIMFCAVFFSVALGRGGWGGGGIHPRKF